MELVSFVIFVKILKLIGEEERILKEESQIAKYSLENRGEALILLWIFLENPIQPYPKSFLNGGIKGIDILLEFNYVKSAKPINGKGLFFMEEDNLKNVKEKNDIKRFKDFRLRNMTTLSSGQIEKWSRKLFVK